MTDLSISTVARRAGLRTSTLRYYESIGLLEAPVRINGQRRYDARVLERLAVIQTAQRAGFTLAEVRVLLDDMLAGAAVDSQWHDLIQRKLAEMDTLIHNAQRMKSLLADILECDGDQLAECIYLTGHKHQVLD